MAINTQGMLFGEEDIIFFPLYSISYIYKDGGLKFGARNFYIYWNDLLTNKFYFKHNNLFQNQIIIKDEIVFCENMNFEKWANTYIRSVNIE